MASFPLTVACLVVLSHLDFINCQLCPQDWTEVDGQCFQVPRDPKLWDPNNRMELDWVEARVHCRALKGDLAQPDNLLDMAEYLRNVAGLDGHDHIWLGGSDVHIEGIWRWDNWTIIPLPIKNKEGIITNHNGWKDGQPNSRDGLNQDCLYMMSAAKFGANVMGDEVCQGGPQHFVCERTPEKIGCVYGFKCYEDGAILNDACIAFECMEGNWKYSGNSTQACGDCTVKGDPHIWTYDSHTLINPPSHPSPPYDGKNPITIITVPGGFEYDAKFAISQQGKDIDPLFGVDVHFKQGGPGWNQTVSFVSSVTYTEPGITVELILPVKLFAHVPPGSSGPLYCQEGEALPNDPLCATTIKVNGETRVIPDDGSVTSFSGTDGTVLVFKVGECYSYKCQIYVVGSKGITVSLLVAPGQQIDGGDWIYYLNVYATRFLHNSLYGLCDTFTGTGTNHYTPRFGPVMTTWSEANITQFIESWKIGCSCAFRDDGDFGSGCVITEAAPAKQACRCSPGYIIGTIPEYCVGTVVDCVDLLSPACTDPNTGYASCLQGQGNCDGYEDVIYPGE